MECLGCYDQSIYSVDLGGPRWTWVVLGTLISGFFSVPSGPRLE